MATATRQRATARRARAEARAEARAVEAFAHPLRMDIMRLVAERGEASPRELADECGVVALPVLSYHVRQLLRAGMLRQTRTEPRRGAIAHFYAVSPHAVPALDALTHLAAALRGHIDRNGS